MFRKKNKTVMNEEVNHKTNEVENENSEGNTSLPIDEVANEEETSGESKEASADAAISELNDKYLRLYADFENYKRRTNQEKLEFLRSAGQEVMVSLLPVLDDFERALKAMNESGEKDAIKEGVQLIYNKFKNILEQKGLKPIQSIGTPFNIDFHEAITGIPAPGPEDKGKVLDEIEKGYLLGDKVVRFAKVVVGE
jgi:molecular chaperone GrpE